MGNSPILRRYLVAVVLLCGVMIGAVGMMAFRNTLSHTDSHGVTPRPRQTQAPSAIALPTVLPTSSANAPAMPTTPVAAAPTSSLAAPPPTPTAPLNATPASATPGTEPDCVDQAGTRPAPGVVPAAPSSSRVESCVFASAALDRVMPYFIFIPPGYDSSLTARYAVLYMLHGVGTGQGGSDTEWYADGLLERADQLMRAGTIPPFLIVLPQGDAGFWVNQANGGPQWGAYTAHDVVAEIDQHFRTVPDRAHRAIGGLSMGADGALQLAMNYPDVFSIAGADSPTLRPYKEMPPFFGDEAYFNAHDPVPLVQAHPDIAKTLRLWIDVGVDDPWLPSAEAFHQQLLRAGIPHEWHVWPGTHSGDYWSAHTADYLDFYGQALALCAGCAGR
jgi:S-formylglutathione hydrolase FrmB